MDVALRLFQLVNKVDIGKVCPRCREARGDDIGIAMRADQNN